MEFRSGDALLAFDEELRVVAWNDAASALTGLGAEEALGRYCWEVLGASDAEGALVCHAGCSYARLAREGWQVPTRRLSIRTAAGPRWVSVATVAVRHGGETTFLHLLRDGPAGDERPRAREAAEPPPLTPRQRQILELLAAGVPAKAVARRLELTEVTVRNHIRGILVRLDSHSQLEAVAKARRLGLLAEPGADG